MRGGRGVRGVHAGSVCQFHCGRTRTAVLAIVAAALGLAAALGRAALGAAGALEGAFFDLFVFCERRRAPVGHRRHGKA